MVCHMVNERFMYCVTRRKQQVPGIAKDDKNDGTNKFTNNQTCCYQTEKEHN